MLLSETNKLILPNKRAEEIKMAAVNILEECNITELPIDPFKIAERRQIIIKPYSKFDKEIRKLMMKASPDGFKHSELFDEYIAYNDKNAPTRIRFTLAHEEGHIFFNHYEESELAEKEANFFAKYILAPPPLIRALEIKDIDDIITVFDISREFAKNALGYAEKREIFGPNKPTDYENRLIKLFAR